MAARPGRRAATESARTAAAGRPTSAISRAAADRRPTIATAAAAIAARARHEVENLFFDNDAFSPDRAVPFEPRMRIQRRYLEQMIGEGVVHEASPGHYWLDLAAYRQMRHDRFVWTMRILAIAVVVVIVVTAVSYFR
jgi:hypothetical protein